MFIRKKLPRALAVNEPLRHASHKRPVTRRDFIAAGFMSGPAMVAGVSLFSLFANPRQARALSDEVKAMNALCTAGQSQNQGFKIPFIAFDFAGGASMVGSEILVGGRGGQLDFLSTAGYARLGLPGDEVPNAPNAGSATNNFIDTTFGAAWHSDGAFLRGMLEKGAAAGPNTNGCVIAARSENDTQNNVHNPMYGIAKAGAKGSLLTLIGSRNSESGGNSMAPPSMIDPTLRPTKVDRASDVTGLVDTGQLVNLLSQQDSVAVLEAIALISQDKLDRVLTSDADRALIDRIKCGYGKAADLVERFGGEGALNPDDDKVIVGDSGSIFTQAEYNDDEEFRKTAAVMKMVIEGRAGAGTITMGGYDYHDGTRATGELRNLRAGRCIGACLEYARRKQTPLMIYAFSDGSLSADGRVDNSVDGRGKFGWQGDNQSTAASFILVYNPAGRPQAIRNQIGWFRPDGSVETASSPAANAVNLLVQTVVLNYMTLNGDRGLFVDKFPNHGLGGTTQQDSVIAFAPL